MCNCNEWGKTQSLVKLDWTDKNNNESKVTAVNAIQDQGLKCNGWAFAATSLMESIDYLTNSSRPIQKFSEQQLLDCNPLNYTCKLGKEDELFTSWLIPNKVNPVLASNYPYTGTKGACKTTVAKTSALATGAIFYFATDHPEVITSALRGGPLNAWINGTSDIFRYYSSGIINNSCCLGSTLTLNHVVTIVGYSVDESGNSNWIIRNSFGTGWGVNGYGYIKIASQGEGICGELNTSYQISMASY